MAELGQRIYVDGPWVTPVNVLEDSRCPADVQCIQAGQVRLQVKIELGARTENAVLTWRPGDENEGVHVADGQLRLTDVQPAPTTAQIADASYRFKFRFDGGF